MTTVIKRLFFLFIGWCFCFLILGCTVYLASTDEIDESTSSASEYISYISVQPEFPANQINNEVSYLDLKMTPGQVEMIPIQVTNHFKEALTIYIRPETAVTSELGRVVYQPDLENAPYDSSLVYPFTSLSHISTDHLLLNANESQTVNLIIEMPEEPIDGMILGGIRFSTDNEFMTHAVDLTKEHIDDYILGVRLIENDNDVPVGLILNDVFLDHLKNQNMFRLNLQNPSPIPITNMHIETSIYQRNRSKQLYTTVLEDWVMAPNSNVLVALPIAREDIIKPGTYTAIMNIASDQGEWELTHDFHITRQEAKLFNERVGNKLPFYFSISKYVLAIIAILLILLMIIFILKLTKKHKLKRKISSEKKVTAPIKHQHRDVQKKKIKKKKKHSQSKKKKQQESVKDTQNQHKLSLKNHKISKKFTGLLLPFKGEQKKISYQVEDVGFKPKRVLKHGKTSSIDLWSQFHDIKNNEERNTLYE